MKKIYILLALVILLGATAVSAAGLYPDRVEVFEIPSGHTCVLVGDYFECYCPCVASVDTIIEYVDTECEDCESCTECAECEECEECKEEAEKVKCNAGRGNGSEGDPDCDPGNSGKNKGGD